MLFQVEKACGARADTSAVLGISLAKTGQFQGALILLHKAKDRGNGSQEVLKWLAKAEAAVEKS